MKQKRNYVTVILSGLMILGLLLVAFGAPGFIHSIYDARMLGQINSRKVAFNTYDLVYDYFPEKLHAIGSMTGMLMENVRIAEESTTLKNKELTEIALREVQKLMNDGLGTNVHFSEKNLLLRKLCAVWGRDYADEESVIAGARYYKLIYELEPDEAGSGMVYYDKQGIDRPILTLYLDEEHHKLYAFALENATWDQLGLVPEQELSVAPLLDYWEVNDYYKVVYLENTARESWLWDKQLMEVSGDTMYFGDDSARLFLWSERGLAKDKSNGQLRMGVSADWLQ